MRCGPASQIHFVRSHVSSLIFQTESGAYLRITFLPPAFRNGTTCMNCQRLWGQSRVYSVLSLRSNSVKRQMPAGTDPVISKVPRVGGLAGNPPVQLICGSPLIHIYYNSRSISGIEQLKEMHAWDNVENAWIRLPKAFGVTSDKIVPPHEPYRADPRKDRPSVIFLPSIWKTVWLPYIGGRQDTSC